MSWKVPFNPRWVTTESPIFVSRSQDAPPEGKNTTFTPHSHDFTEFVFIHSGKGDHVVNGHRYSCRQGQFYLIPAGCEHFFIPGCRLVLTNVLFIHWRMQETFRELREIPGFYYLFNIYPAKLAENQASVVSIGSVGRFSAVEILDRMIDENAKRFPGYKSLLRSLFIEFIVLLCRSAGTEDAGRLSAEENISRLIGMLQNRYYEGWTVKRMADKTGLSEPSLYRLFKQLTGTSPTDYLLNLRLQHAKDLLENTGISVTEAAFETGFGNSSYFTRVFKKKYRCTPNQLKKKAF